MSWFSRDPVQEQLDIYNDLLSEKQNQLNELKEVGTASAALQREELEEEIQNIQLNIEQTKEGLEQEKGFSLNDFND